MGNARSQQSEVEPFYDTFNQPHELAPGDAESDVDDEGQPENDETDLESDVMVVNERFVCPQCGDRYACPRILYSQNSACKKCIDKLKRATVPRRQIQSHLFDSRFPQSVSWDFEVLEKSPKLDLDFSDFSEDEDETEKKNKYVNKKVRPPPAPLSRRGVLQRVNEVVDFEMVEEEKPPKRALMQRRQSTVPPTFFKMLTNGEFRMRTYHNMSSRPSCMCVIHGNIWCAQDNEIIAFTIDFEPIEFVELDQYRIKHDLMTEIQALTQLNSGRIAVACGSGLHILTKAGRYDGRITEGVFTDVAVHEDALYACVFGSFARAKVQMYDETMPWALIRTIHLPCDGLVTAHVSESMITVCSAMHGGLYVLDYNGKLIQKCALKRVNGNIGQFNEPRICQGGFDGSILVADRENQYLQARTVNGEWGMVSLEKKVLKPTCALFYKRQLFIAQTTEPYRIYKYV